MTDENVEKMEKCSHFNKCSQNLCPLDSELVLRTGGEGDKCRWMRDPKLKRIGDKEFISGGSVMPNALLNFVSESNLERLNGSSREAWIMRPDYTPPLVEKYRNYTKNNIKKRVWI